MRQTIKHLKDLRGWPLMLAGEQAAAHTGLSTQEFERAVTLGHLPEPRMLAGNVLWSRPEIDRLLDTTPAALAGAPERGPLVDPILEAIAAYGAQL